MTPRCSSGPLAAGRRAPGHAATVLALALLASGTIGCDGPPAPQTDPAAGHPAPDGDWSGEACAPMAGEAGRGGDLVLALAGTVVPTHAPVPLGEAERVVFANLYETLTRVACTGETMAGLAVRWERQDAGRRWLLHLRPDAVFWDGTPVTAATVISAWQRNARLADATGRPCPGLWLATRGGLRARAATQLEVTLAEPQDQLPRLLAHPALAVALVRDGWTWPVGTGPCRLAADTEAPLPDLRCRPNLHHPEAPAWRSFRFRILPGADARDLLTAGVDLAVIRDRQVAAFYAERPEVRTAPLPWDRLHLLLLPPESPVAPTAATALASDPALATAGVAEHAAWDRLVFHGCRPGPCPQLAGPTVGLVGPPPDPDAALQAMAAGRLVHDADDPDARALAERAAAFLDPPLRVVGEHGAGLARALQAGHAGAYVVAVDACYPDACLTVAALLARADWLQAGIGGEDDPCAAAARLRADGWAVPLTRSRARLVWTGPLAGLTLTHDGVPLVAGLGPAVAPELP